MIATEQTTGAQALLRTLREHGATMLFGIPGVHTLLLYDALVDEPGLRPIVTRHEAGAAFAAEGYARLTGRPGVVSVVPGPGALNAANSVLCAWSDRVPMVLLTPEINASDRVAYIHEGDLEAAYRPLVKAQLRITARAEVEPILCEALSLAVRPPAGPVQILFPLDVLSEPSLPHVCRHAEAPEITPDMVDGVENFLNGLQAPALLLGNGVFSAREEAMALIERLQAPTFTDVGARGLIPEDHPLSAGLLPWPGAAETLAHCDGLLVLGSRLSEISTLNWAVHLPERLARVDPAPDHLQSNYPATLTVHADPARLLEPLLALLPARPARPGPVRPPPPFRTEGSTHGATGGIHPRAAVRELRSILPRDTVVTTDGTATEFWLSEETFPIYAPAGFLVPEVQQTMGYALAAAVGATLGADEIAPGRPVVCITGDGSLQMMLGELASAADLQRQITVVIFEDGYYNALRIYQEGLYGREMGVKLRNPDFMALGKAYTPHVWRVERLTDLRPALEQALTISALSIIILAIDPKPVPDRYARRLEQMMGRPSG